MRLALLAALIALACGAGPAGAAASAALDVESLIGEIDGCRERLDPQIDIGYERIAARCPRLARRLEQTGLAAWLPEGWKDAGNNLSVGSLQELAVLIQRELSVAANRPAPSVKHLPGVLAEIGQSTHTGDSLWKRVRLWLHKVFPTTEEPADTGWIARMISRIGMPQTVIEIITYVALGIVVGLGVLILVNEARAAGFFRRGAAREKQAAAAGTQPEPFRVAWSDVEAAAPADQPRLLLELVLDRLTRARLLPPARSLTVRELARAAKLSAADDKERLLVLAQTAERVRYSDSPAEPPEIERALKAGHALLNTLEHAR